MMTDNWSRPRNRVIENTLIALRRGYYLTVAEAAESVTRFDYQGKSPAIARALLQRDLAREYYAQVAPRRERRHRQSERRLVRHIHSGWVSHIILDAFSNGAPAFWPWRLSLAKIKTGGRTDRLVGGAALIIAASLALSMLA